MIGGFMVSGSDNKSILIRALGPSLATVGVRSPLPNPDLQLYDSTGALIAENDNWTSLPPGTVPDGLQPGNPAESVIAQTVAPGSYTAVLSGVNGASGNALVELYDLDPGNSRVLNMSTRGRVGTDDDVMIGGFIVGGVEPAKVLLRAIGPSLTAFGVQGALADPIIELHNSDGSLIYQNDDWRSTQERDIINTTVQPSSNKESAILVTLPPGGYTAIVRGANATSGVALIELYALDHP
jgi:hypothetical protein